MHVIPVRRSQPEKRAVRLSLKPTVRRPAPTNSTTLPGTVRIAEIDIAAGSTDEAIRRIILAAQQSSSAAFHFINAYTISLASSDPDLKQVLNDGTAAFPDGRPLSWFARIKAPAAQQVRGPSTFEGVFQRGQEHGVKHFLLGSTPETLDKLVTGLRLRYPTADIVGAHSPPYRPLTDAELSEQDELIRTSGANIVWVGLGTPKQDFETHRIAEHLGMAAAAVGAAFDFSAGTKREAPAWITPLGLEWLFRLLMEPRRLWKRYLFGNPIFLKEVLVHWSND
ncbi:Putative N-acetylmannosaminyltransferase [Kocuria rosea]|nr:Putative N-acetylmannosaminyltransferase [Kocuria rosea]